MPDVKLRRRWRRSGRALGFFLERGLGAFQIGLHRPFKMGIFAKAQIAVAISVVLVEVLGQLGIARRFLLGDHAVVEKNKTQKTTNNHPKDTARFGRRGVRPGIAGGQRSKAKCDDYFIHDNSPRRGFRSVDTESNAWIKQISYAGHTSVRCDQYKWC